MGRSASLKKAGARELRVTVHLRIGKFRACWDMQASRRWSSEPVGWAFSSQGHLDDDTSFPGHSFTMARAHCNIISML